MGPLTLFGTQVALALSAQTGTGRFTKEEVFTRGDVQFVVYAGSMTPP